MYNSLGWEPVDSRVNNGYLPAKFAPFILLVVATGSSYAAERLDEWQPYVKTRIPLQIDEARETSLQVSGGTFVEAFSLPEKVSFILETFNYGVSDLAKLFGITRQAIYKWKKAEVSPEPVVSDKLNNLAKIAAALSDADVKRAGELIKLKYFDNESLVEKAMLNKMSDHYLEEVLSYIVKMQAANDKLASASKSTRESEWLSSTSIPHSSDNS